ncbi:MAG: hypothetical protein FWC39_00630 [Bacteroidetes bacterium]|nr:hypothetical protein [Bacteroidota bacterium]
MKKIIVSLFFFVVCSFSLIGQNEAKTLPWVTYYVAIDSIKIEVSGEQITQLVPQFGTEWIEKIDIFTHPEFEIRAIYSNYIPGVYIFHIKQEYKQNILTNVKPISDKEIKKRKMVPNR